MTRDAQRLERPITEHSGVLDSLQAILLCRCSSITHHEAVGMNSLARPGSLLGKSSRKRTRDVEIDEEGIRSQAYENDDSITDCRSYVQGIVECDLPPHGQLRFTSVTDLEIHYLQQHTNRCHVCQKNFPSDHYLRLHVTENHDSFAAVRREREETIVRDRHLN